MKLFSPMEPSSACSYVATQRGGVALLFEGHRYNKVRDGKDGTVYWRCSRDRQCPGRAVTVNNRVKKSNNKHNHPPEASLLIRNGQTGAGGHVHNHGNNNNSNNNNSSNNNNNNNNNHNHSNANNSAMAAAAAAAAAYAQFLQGSNSNGNNNGNNAASHANLVGSKSGGGNSSMVINAIPTRPPPHHSPSTASSSSPSPLGMAGSIGSGAGSNPFSNAFSFLHNLAANAGSSVNANHLLSGSLLTAAAAASQSDNGARQALNLSNHHSPDNAQSPTHNSRLPFNHLNNHFNLFNTNASTTPATSISSNHHHSHHHQRSSPAKMTQSSSPPNTPTSNHHQQQQQQHLHPNSAMFSKSLQSQYNSLLKGVNVNSNTLDLSPRSFNFGMSQHHQHLPTNLSTQHHNSGLSLLNNHSHGKTIEQSSNSPPPPSVAAAAITQSHNMAAAFMLQDAFQEAQAAAVAAAAFPSLLSETFKYLAAAAATNPQMAAALATNLSSPTMMKNFDLTMATAAAAAVAAAANQSNNNGNGPNSGTANNGGNSNGDSANSSVHSKSPHGDDDVERHSPFTTLRELSGGSSVRDDLDLNSFHNNHHHHHQQQQHHHQVHHHNLNHHHSNNRRHHLEEQPLNMALNDRGNILKVLRTLMRSGGMASSYNRSSSTEPGRDPFHALIVPTADAHGSEYIASCDARREFITNFTGSSGTAVVTLKEAALWTDGRYFLQADAQLDKCHWIMMKDRQPETPTVGEWLNKCLASGSRIGADPYTLSYDEWIKLEKELSQSGNVLTSTPVNLIDEIWSRRPPRPAEPVLPLNMSFTGKRWQDKIESIRNEMTHKEAAILVLTALDDIAWLFNLRGSDIPFNPVFFAYAIISMDKVYLFIDDSKLSSSALAHLQTNNGLDDPMDTMSSSSSSERSTPSSVVPNVGNDGTNRSSPSPQQMVTNCSTGNNNRSCEVEIRSYDLVADFIRSYIAKNSTGRVWISNQSSYALVNLIPESRRIITRVSPVALQKSVKNSVEIGGMRRAHIKDAVALCEFFAWLEDEIVNHGHHHGRSRKVSNPAASPSSTSSGSSSLSSGTSSSIIDELAVDAKLEEFRRQQDDYMGPSFQTIAGVGPNSAIIHYQSKEETNRPITTDEIFLLDTGAQFRDGTTDITRTVHFGTPTAHERECFTRVVKGHISLATARFPRLIVGQLLDSYARRSLWDVGLDYNHGTGHGVGSFLNVHEGPSSISNRTNPNDSGIVEDMVFSNEPGYYESGNFGIRIESLVITKKIDLKFNFNDRGYLGFETITLVPIQTKLLDPSLMTREEIEWIDQYHQQCRDIVGKELEQQGRTRALQWLIKETEPMEK